MTPSGAAPDSVVLSLANVTKRYDTGTALDDVSLSVRAGTVHALLGENGAGKTTLMRVAFGLTAPDSGDVRARDGRRVTSAIDAIDAGLGMVHQHFTNVPAMTVAENVALGGRGRYRRLEAERVVAEIGVRTGLTLDARARADQLTVGALQRLEIVKALARNANVLILDEPTAVLAPNEIDELLHWIRGFADAGNAVVLITHKLREALSVADEVTVLRRGQVVLRAPATEVDLDSLSRALLGSEPPDIPRPLQARAGGQVVRAENIAVKNSQGRYTIRDASFTMSGGELVGIAAVEGAGQHELLRALARRSPIDAGSLRLPDTVAFVPEDRHRDALVLEFTTTENVTLGGAGQRYGTIPWSSEKARTRTAIAEFDVRGADESTPVSALSGGNQQKLVFARELDSHPSLVVVENPTRGLDIRATRAVHERLRAAAAAGAAVVVYSSDLDEVLSLASRVLVIHSGLLSECARDRDAVGRAMLGVA